MEGTLELKKEHPKPHGPAAIPHGSHPNLPAGEKLIEPASKAGRRNGNHNHAFTRAGFAVVVIAVIGAGIVGYRFIYRLYHPPLPPAIVISDLGQLNNGVWTEAERQRYYHLSQGAQLMPYAWFVALEQFGNQQSFIAPEHTATFRLIADPNALNNPDRLPVGLAKDDPDPITGIENVGLTCAACHTAQLSYKGRGLQVDGAPGKVDFDAFLERLGLAVGETLAMPSKFDRFAKKVLQDQYNEANAKKLKSDVAAFLANRKKAIANQKDADQSSGQEPVKAGFGRMDAMGSGGNRLYGALSMKNLRTLNAPVKALPLWNSSRYSWLQTNGSIRQPMARNVIQALTSNASLVFPGPKKDRYVSSVRLQNIHELDAFTSRFTPPVWPGNILGKLNEDAVRRGEPIYKHYCAACHEPQMENRPQPDDPIAVKHNQTNFVARLFPVSTIGTDPMDANNFAERTLDASAIDEGKDVPGAKIIGLVLSNVMKREYDELNIPVEKQEELDGYRDNLLRPCRAYAARPLAGAWANSPYLHNGSIPNLYQLLLPAARRVKQFYTGDLEFDPVNVGYISDGRNGGFMVDTTIPGNSNAGHEFGNSLSHEQRMDLIEYLKGLSLADKNYRLVDPQSNCPS